MTGSQENKAPKSAVMAGKRSTALGIATIIGAIALAAQALLDADPATNPDFNQVVLTVVGGLGLIFKTRNW